MFRAAKQSRIFQDIVDQIQEAILSGSIKSGEMLPSERELKEMFQTSRGTLREALRVLEQKGLIQIKLGVGGGAMIKTANTEQIGESLDILIRSQKVSLSHLCEFREGVEGDVVALAAERATNADIKRLKELLKEAKRHAEKGGSHRDPFLEVDKKIHLALSQISRNPIYISVLKMVHNNIHSYLDSFLHMEKRELMENYQDLYDMVQALEKGDAAKSKSIAQSHVRRFTEYMEKEKKQTKD
ncbi:MAG: FadR family transcriptional regulator [Deltaproteobacteria bacterium]|nr:FadR family transcriptional regulator [Deltaproteobacteria bacterium]